MQSVKLMTIYGFIDILNLSSKQIQVIIRTNFYHLHRKSELPVSGFLLHPKHVMASYLFQMYTFKSLGRIFLNAYILNKCESQLYYRIQNLKNTIKKKPNYSQV